MTTFRTLLRRFRSAQRGVAAIEFAIILPVLVTTYLGLVQIAQGVIVDRKVTLLARTLSDLTAQAQSIGDTEMNNIFEAARYVLQPVDATPAKMLVLSLYIDKNSKVNICWSETRGATVPSSVTLPTGLIVPETSVVMATASYKYDGVVKLFPGDIPLEETIYMRPRFPPQVLRVTGGNTKSCSTT